MEEDKFDSLLLDLNEVKSCIKKKIFKSVNIGTTKKERLETRIDKIVLAFEFKETRQPVQVTFFDPRTNHIYTMPEWEQKATHWQTMFSQLVNTGLKKIA